VGESQQLPSLVFDRGCSALGGPGACSAEGASTGTPATAIYTDVIARLPDQRRRQPWSSAELKPPVIREHTRELGPDKKIKTQKNENQIF
jgi:hypothetical protein